MSSSHTLTEADDPCLDLDYSGCHKLSSNNWLLMEVVLMWHKSIGY